MKDITNLLWQAPRAAPENRRASHRDAWSTRPIYCFTAERAERQLPLRARSSTGWAGGALRYDGGLEAHRNNRAAPKRPALGLAFFFGLEACPPAFRPIPSDSSKITRHARRQ